MIDVQLRDLVHVYPGGVRALAGVDLVVKAGSRLALIGQNGSGKSTLVRHLNGLLRPTAGRVIIGDRDARDRTVAQLAHDVGLVFQNPDRQIFASDVRAEVAFGPRNLGSRGTALDDAVTEALEACGLQDEADTNPYDLGPSRRKLLAIASVIAMRTPVLILDEPTTGQDLRGVKRVRAILDRAQAAGQTVIAISHDMRFVAESFDRIVAMRQGHVVLDGAPADVFSAASWDTLRSTFVEPPLAARVGHGLGLGSTPTDDAVVAALSAARR
jgi:energy-coupling factor transport system ATP-binding protein